MAATMVLFFFFISSFFYIANCVLAFFLRKREELLIRISTFFNIIAGVSGLSYSLIVLIFNQELYYKFPFAVISTAVGNPSIHGLTIKISALNCFFLALIYLLSSVSAFYSSSYIRQYLSFENHFETPRIPLLTGLFSLFILSMVMVSVSNHAIIFLISWEMMSLFSFFLVMTEHEKPQTRSAGFTYLIMTHFGTAFLFMFLAIMFSMTSSLDFADYANIGAGLGGGFKTGLFIMLLIGFGTKAGIVPLHIWLPQAHPQAPSHVSALMSGVMVKVSMLMFLRFTFEFLGRTDLVCGIITLAIGSITAILGIMYAVVESDIKKSLAFSTIENVGIIFSAFACALILNSQGEKLYAAFALTAMLYHILAHSFFKTLLFLNAGAVIHSTHTRNMDEMGGLIRKMPQTAFYFLAGAMCMASLPPMAAFVSKWLVFQSVLLTLKSPENWIKIIVPVAGASLALASALASFNAVKNMFSIFLARNRGPHKYMHDIGEASFQMRVSMLIVTVLCFVFGIFSPSLLSNLKFAVGGLIPEIMNSGEFFTEASAFIIPVHKDLASISPLLVFSGLIILLIMLKFAVNFLYSRRGFRVYETWSCGADIDETMEYTPESYSQPLMVVFKNIYRPKTDIETVHNEDRYIVKRVTYNQAMTPFFETYLYKPLTRFVFITSSSLKRMQVGYIHVYLLYIFVTLIVLLLAVR